MRIYYQHVFVTQRVFSACYRTFKELYSGVINDWRSATLDLLSDNLDDSIKNVSKMNNFYMLEYMKETYELLETMLEKGLKVNPTNLLYDERDVLLVDKLREFFKKGYGHWPKATR